MSAQSTAAGRPFLKLHYDFLEEVMPVLTGNEFKVAVCIYRETIGWNREQTAISYTDLEAKTGMNRRTLMRAIKGLLSKGIIYLCEKVGRWGMHIYSIARHFVTGEPEPPSSDKTTLVQRQLPGTSDKFELVLVTKMHQNYGQNDTTTSDKNAPEPPCQPAPEEVPDTPKESLKERFKENNKERIEVEEKKEEEDEERRSADKRRLLNKRILDAKDHARTARKIGKYAGWTEAQWDYEEKLARRELAELDAAVRSSA